MTLHCPTPYRIGAYLVLSACLFLVLPASAQANKQLDSLHKALRQHPHDSIKCQLLKDIWLLQVYDNLDTATATANTWLHCAIQLNDTQQMVFALHGLTMATAMGGNYDEALTHGIRAAKLAEATTDPGMLYQPCNDLGIICTKHNRADQALIYHKKALEAAPFDTRGGELSIGSTYQNLANTYRMLDSIELAFDYLHKARDHYRATGHYGNVLDVTVMLATHEIERGDTAAAGPYLDTLEQSTIRDGSLYYRGLVSDLLGLYHHWARNYRKAEQFLKEGLTAADSSGHNDLRMYLHQHLHEFYREMQQQELAIHHLKRHFEVKEEIFNEQATARMAELEVAFESEHQKLEIAELNAMKAQREVAIKNQRAQLAGLAGGFGLLALLGLFGWQRFRLRKQAELQRLLAEQQKEGTRAILLAQEAERKRIARDLHDGVGQMIATLKLT